MKYGVHRISSTVINEKLSQGGRFGSLYEILNNGRYITLAGALRLACIRDNLCHRQNCFIKKCL